MDNKKIGNYIKYLRKEKGLTQQELGDMVGVSFKAVSKWETGSSLPDISILTAVSKALDISVDELLNAGRGKNYISKKKKKNGYLVGIFIFIILVVALVICLGFIYKSFGSTDDKSIDNNDYNCVFTRTYNVQDMYDSNDENYLYVTLSQFQIEGVYTVKLSKTVANNLEVGKMYEFTFNSLDIYLYEDVNVLFNNSELINVLLSSGEGLSLVNEYTCR